MDEGTRSPDRTDDGVRSIGDPARSRRPRIRSRRRSACSLFETSDTASARLRRCTTSRPCWPMSGAVAERAKTGPDRAARPRERVPSPRSRRGSPISARIRSGSTGSARPIAAPPWPRSTPRCRTASCRRGSDEIARSAACGLERSNQLLPIFSSTGSRCVRNVCRIFAHREVAEPLHDGDLAAGNAVRHRKRFLRRAGIIVFAGQQKQRAASGVDLRDPAADVAVELVEIAGRP